MNAFFYESLVSIFSQCSVCSKRSAKTFFKNNSICVNGKEVKDFKININRLTDVITVNGTKLKITPHIYIMMNKPKDAVCSTVSDRHKTVFDFIPQNLKENTKFNALKCGGRLDCDTTGLLLFSTNGAFLHNITSPENKITKTYHVILRDKVSAPDMTEYKNAAAGGITIPAQKKSPLQKCAPAFIDFINESECNITVTEGKFHEVRRIFLALKNEVVFLKRIAVGSLVLDENLQEGQCRLISQEEAEKIFKNK